MTRQKYTFVSFVCFFASCCSLFGAQIAKFDTAMLAFFSVEIKKIVEINFQEFSRQILFKHLEK